MAQPSRARSRGPAGGLVEELLRTHDPVALSFVEALLREAGIEVFVFDPEMSFYAGINPWRVMVPGERAEEARRLLSEAGVELGSRR